MVRSRLDEKAGHSASCTVIVTCRPFAARSSFPKVAESSAEFKNLSERNGREFWICRIRKVVIHDGDISHDWPAVGARGWPRQSNRSDAIYGRRAAHGCALGKISPQPLAPCPDRQRRRAPGEEGAGCKGGNHGTGRERQTDRQNAQGLACPGTRSGAFCW
jgi:hypothetical protein